MSYNWITRVVGCGDNGVCFWIRLNLVLVVSESEYVYGAVYIEILKFSFLSKRGRLETSM